MLSPVVVAQSAFGEFVGIVKDPSGSVICGCNVMVRIWEPTSVAGQVLHMEIGMVKPGMLADLTAPDGDPTREISAASNS